ncbi:glycosyltransferase family 2 protein [Serratia ureilytica]
MRKTEEQCGGIAQLRHQLAQSEIVFFLDSDDYFTTNYIIRRMKKHEDRQIDIIFGNYAEVSGDSVRDFNFHYKSGSSGEDFLFLEMGDIRSSTISMRKKAIAAFYFPSFSISIRIGAFWSTPPIWARKWRMTPAAGCFSTWGATGA